MDRLGGRPEDALSRFARLGWIALGAITVAVAAFLRFDALHEPCLWLDEILGRQLTAKAFAQPWWHWLIGFESEHGPLYYLTNGRSFAALCGVITVAVLWMLPIERNARFAAAAMLAISPLHVYYSREARPYALLMFLTALLLVALLREWDRVSGIVLIAMAYTSAVSAPIIATAFIRKKTRIFALVALALIPLLYRSTPRSDIAFADVPLDTILRAFTVSALGEDIRGRAMFAALACALAGAYALFRKDRRTALVVLVMTLVPVLLAVASLRLFGHWFSIRYVSPGIIGFAILAGCGIAFVTRVPAIALVVLIAFGTQTWDTARREPFQKLDWRLVAQALREHVRPGDLIISAEDWSDVSLRHYLGEIPGVRFLPVHDVPMAKIHSDNEPATWFVTAGFSSDTGVRDFACRFPVVLASPLESFRLHYKGPPRRGAPELRAAAAALDGYRLHFGPEAEPFLGEGWASPEEGFRWAIARRATITLPQRGRTIRFYALPLPPQTMRVSLNGHLLAELAMPDEWHDYAIDAPPRFWRDGENTIAFEFTRAESPSPRDTRTLAASFAWIGIDEVRDLDRPPIPMQRIAADLFLDAKTAWRDTRSRLVAKDHAAAARLFGRLGYDPRLAGRANLDDVVQSVAYGSDCDDDATFLTRAFATLLERKPNDVEKRDLLARLRKGATREEIAMRIARADDSPLRYVSAKDLPTRK